MSNKRITLIPLLILVYFFFHYATDLFYFLNPWKSILQFLKYFLISGVLYLTGYLVFKKKEGYTFAFSAILFLFLFFGSFTDTAIAYGLVKPFTGIDLKLMAAFIALCILILFLSMKLSGKTAKKLLFFWLIYCSVLLVYDTAAFIFTSKKEKKYLDPSGPVIEFTSENKPSVFFLLYDMYPSDSVLRKYLGYDNSSLNSFLIENRFFVSGNARSSYEETYYSLGSTLSLQSLDYVHDNTIKDYKKKLIALKNLEHASLLNGFVRSGYVFRNYSVFDLKDQPSPLQFNLNYHLDNILTATTFFNRLYHGIEPDFILANRNIDIGFIKRAWSGMVKEDILTLNNGFDRLMHSFDTTRPSFNYFHFMIPHPPAVYDSTGQENPVRSMYSYGSYDKAVANFISYTKFGNKQIKKMVSRIFEKAGKNVIIIIQGDHGYREYRDRFPDAVRYGILNAVYLPGNNYGSFNDTMNPVHTFKQVLQDQFHSLNDE